MKEKIEMFDVNQEVWMMNENKARKFIIDTIHIKKPFTVGGSPRISYTLEVSGKNTLDGVYRHSDVFATKEDLLSSL